jgi:hypothetical protein
MTGHEALIAMRKRGYVPRVVFIDTDPDPLAMERNWPDVNRSHACINVGPTDSLASLDLRCVVGLAVVVSGHSSERCRRLGKLCEDAGAKRVVVTIVRTTWRGDMPRSEVLACTDTAGVIA